MRSCGACGKSLDHRPRARFCDGTCRVRYSRGQRSTGPIAPVVDLPPDDEAPLLDLEDVARELGRQLRSPATPAAAKAGLAREYRATLAEIERRAPKAKDGIDMLAERRARRVSG